MTEDRLITVAIHTYDKAVALKNLLEHEGLEVVLHNVNLSQPVVSSGVRVRIKETDLPLALRIIENAEIFSQSNKSENETAKTILAPVDFSDYSFVAATIAFDIAFKHKAEVLLLHSFINPAMTKRIQLTDSFSFELAESQEIQKQMQDAARKSMESFCSKIKERIKNGDIPAVKFRSVIAEGVPEDVINETAKNVNPVIIVMGTRGSSRKEEEMIGSVTAEVLDSCRYPVLSIPESVSLRHASDIKQVVFFSNLDQEDILALESLHRILNDIHLNVTIVHIPGKKDRDDNTKEMESLVEYCRDHYPGYTFEMEQIRLGNAMEDYRKISDNHKINLIALPNKKRNVFSRFFNPSLAHKLLLHADVPMVVIPV